MAHFTDGFKANMIQRMLGPEQISASALARESGVSLAALSRWRQHARTLATMSGNPNQNPVNEKSPRDWSSEEKLRVVVESAKLRDEELGEFLRREGLHEAQINEWRKVAATALSENPLKPKRSKQSSEAKRISQLERELTRKNAALAETGALLALSKKARALWGDADDDTPTNSARPPSS